MADGIVKRKFLEAPDECVSSMYPDKFPVLLQMLFSSSL